MVRMDLRDVRQERRRSVRRVQRPHGRFNGQGLGPVSRGRHRDAVLPGQGFIDRQALQLLRQDVAAHVGDHQRHDDGVVARDLENHDDAGHRGAHDAGEGRAHAYQGVGAGVAGVVGHQGVGDLSDGASQHGADEEGGAEDAARVARTIAGAGGDELQHQEQQHHLQGHLTVERVAHQVVADSEYTGSGEGQQSHQSGRRRPE